MSNLPNRETVCSVKDCGKHALFYPVAKVWAEGVRKSAHNPMTVEVGLQFCGAHKDGFTMADVPGLDEVILEVAKAMKKQKPDTASMEFEMLPLIL